MDSRLVLLRRLLTLEHVTSVDDRGWIDGDVAFVDVLNDAFFIDHEGGSISKALLFVKDTVILHDSAFEITEDWKGNANLLCEFAVGGNAVYAHAKNLGVG